MDNSARITKSIRLNPNLDKKINKYCKLEGISQADFINNTLNDSFKNKTLDRVEKSEMIEFNLPANADDIKECIENKINLITYENPNTIIIQVNINNYLDKWINQTYQNPYKSVDYVWDLINPIEHIEHTGLILIEKEGQNYFIYLKYLENKDSYVSLNQLYLIDESEAKQLAELSENKDLIVMLNNFVGGESESVVAPVDPVAEPKPKVTIFNNSLTEKSKEVNKLKKELEEYKEINNDLNNELENLNNVVRRLELENQTIKEGMEENLKKIIQDLMMKSYKESQDKMKE